MEIYIVRHGQDEDNAHGILNGHRDMPLTPLGVKQAHTLGTEIKKHKLHFDVVLASPLKRAFQTAEIATQISGQPSPVMHEKLIERDFGIMSGVEISKIEEMCAPDIIKTDTVTYFLHPEGAETFPEMKTRASALLAELGNRYTNKKVLIVAHGDIGKMLYAAYYDLSWKEVLTGFHFGNSEVLLLSAHSKAEDVHLFTFEQHNH